MAFRQSRIIVFIIYSSFLVLQARARSWDLAVTIGKEVHFFSNNRSETGLLTTREAVDLAGIAYDDLTHTIFLTDSKNTNLTIFSKNTTIKGFAPRRLLKSPQRTHIFGLAYDARSKNLYWPAFTEKAIMSIHVTSNKSSSEDPNIVLEVPDQSPRGISLDVCNRRLYWANSNTSSPSIESSNLDGSEKKTVIQSNLFEPLGVSVDHWSAKLYWIDDEEGVYYKIERSNLDGSNRELLVHGRHQQPYNLAVDREAIYWSDWSSSDIWKINKNVKPGEEPVRWISLQDSNRDSDPKSIVARDNVGDVDCTAMSIAERKNAAENQPIKSEEERENTLVTSTEIGDSITENSSRCLNDGTYDDNIKICRCKHGFEGAFCEKSLCHNYCVNGECYMTAGGHPRCKCNPSYQGPRCENNICDGFCLNDGQCTIKNREPFCTCKTSFGSRCEKTYDMKEVCAIFCASQLPALNSIDTSSCRCSSGNETLTAINPYSEDIWCKTLIIIFSTLLGALTIVVLVLSYYVNKLRRRPRVRKRFVVSKTGITPLTARPQLPSDQCEIMIENCCNMNICETPCFEPKLRNGETNGRKKDEKNSLLDNMEGNSC